MEALELNVPYLGFACKLLHGTPSCLSDACCKLVLWESRRESTTMFPKIKQTRLFLRKLVHVHVQESRFLLRNEMWGKLDMSLLVVWKRIMITAYC